MPGKNAQSCKRAPCLGRQCLREQRRRRLRMTQPIPLQPAVTCFCFPPSKPSADPTRPHFSIGGVRASIGFREKSVPAFAPKARTKRSGAFLVNGTDPSVFRRASKGARNTRTSRFTPFWAQIAVGIHPSGPLPKSPFDPLGPCSSKGFRPLIGWALFLMGELSAAENFIKYFRHVADFLNH